MENWAADRMHAASNSAKMIDRFVKGGMALIVEAGNEGSGSSHIK
jgi:hypothetical protein